jgi:hypothetical protein
MCTTPPPHLQSDRMVERYIKAVEEHLRKVVTSHRRDSASPRDTTRLTPAHLVLGENSDCLPTCYLGHLQIRSDQQQIMQQT